MYTKNVERRGAANTVGIIIIIIIRRGPHTCARQIHDIRLGARGRTAVRWRRGRWRPVRGDAVLASATGDGRRTRGGGGGEEASRCCCCWYAPPLPPGGGGGGIVTRRRPSPFPFPSHGVVTHAHARTIPHTPPPSPSTRPTVAYRTSNASVNRLSSLSSRPPLGSFNFFSRSSSLNLTHFIISRVVGHRSFTPPRPGVTK